MRNIFAGFFLLIFIFFSCKEEKKDLNKVTKEEKTSSLIKKKELRYKLNKTSTLFNISSASFYANSSGKQYFSFLNTNDNSLVIYENEKPLSIKLSIEGPNGVNKIGSLTSHKIISPDSIIILNSQTGRLFLVNKEGKRLNAYELIDIKNKKGLQTYPGNNSIAPILYYENKVILKNNFSRYFKDYSNIGTIKVVDLNSAKTYDIFELSKKYEKGFWGALFKYSASTCLTHNNHLLVSYPIDDVLYEIDLEGNVIDSFNCKSEFIDKFLPMSNNMIYGNNQNADWKKIGNYSFYNSDYAGILYDKYRERYYRIVYLRPSREEVLRGNTIPDFSILILDKTFNVVDEHRFNSSQYFPSLILVSKEGLAIARKDMYLKDDNYLVFDVYN